MKAATVARVLTGTLIFQIGIGAMLIFGDVQDGFRLPTLAPNAPNLSEPVRPGDQRREFDPGRHVPNLNPVRDPGELPERLVLTQEGSSGLYRLEGGVADGDAERIIKQIERSEPAVTQVILQSPGGSVRDALSLGRYLREHDIGTQMLRGEYCYSACPYILAGGAERRIEDGASVGVHQHYFGENQLLPAFVAVEDIQRGQGEVMVYLEQMGIDPMVMQHSLTTPSDEIYILLPEELRAYNFVTETG